MSRKQKRFASLAAWVASQPSQGEAARTLKISEGYLSMLLSDQRIMSRDKALEISEITGIPVAVLLKINAA